MMLKNFGPQCALFEARSVPSDHIASSRHARGDSLRGVCAISGSNKQKRACRRELSRAERASERASERREQAGAPFFFSSSSYRSSSLVLVFAFSRAPSTAAEHKIRTAGGAREYDGNSQERRAGNWLSEKNQPTKNDLMGTVARACFVKPTFFKGRRLDARAFFTASTFFRDDFSHASEHLISFFSCLDSLDWFVLSTEWSIGRKKKQARPVGAASGFDSKPLFFFFSSPAAVSPLRSWSFPSLLQSKEKKREEKTHLSFCRSSCSSALPISSLVPLERGRHASC